MRTIGITQRDQPPTAFGEIRSALDVRWYFFLAACQAVAVPLPGDAALAVRAAEHLGLDALVLSGGDDLAAYGGRTPHRDRAEEALLRWAVENGVPVLGVCRGMQLIATAFGAALEPVEGHVAVRHEISFSDGGRREVNSYHRWGVRAVPEPLEADAVCAGVVEKLHHRDARVTGVMWHPEREEPFAAADIALVGGLLAGAR